MKKESQVTEKDYREFFKELHVWYQPASKIIILVLVVMLFAMSIYTNKNYTWTDTLFTLIIVAFFMFGLLFALPYTIETMRFELAKDQKKFTEYTIKITEEGIIINECDKQVLCNFSDIKKSRLTPNFLSLRLNNKIPGTPSNLLLVHRSDTSSVNELSKFFNNRYKSAYAVNRPVNNKKVPYEWGMLSIIPFIGGVNGIIMVINGIFKYKSIVYVILGALGIFFTVLVFNLMKPDLNGKEFNASFSEASRNELNSLVKNIEFYKLQHNQYPDSLQQLTDEDKTIDIHDPIYTFKKGKEGLLFNYKKIGNKYTLFSSGIDMIPHTADDIYPTVSITDTSKIGLIKR